MVICVLIRSLTYCAGRVSLILRSMDILSDATILNPYWLIVLCASASSPLERITGTPRNHRLVQAGHDALLTNLLRRVLSEVIHLWVRSFLTSHSSRVVNCCWALGYVWALQRNCFLFAEEFQESMGILERSSSTHGIGIIGIAIAVPGWSTGGGVQLRHEKRNHQDKTG